jgi:hypothetical protein
VGTGTKEDESSTGRVWAAGFHHVTACSGLARVLKRMKLLLFNFQFLWARGKPPILNQLIRVHDCTALLDRTLLAAIHYKESVLVRKPIFSQLVKIRLAFYSTQI